MPFAIGVEHPKHAVNLGTLLRSAWNFEASLVFTVGARYKRQSSDTVKAWRHIPLLHFETWEDYRQHAPFAWQPVAVEIIPGAIEIGKFFHPRSAVYLLGPEDGRLSQEALDLAKQVISIPSRRCLNVAVAGAVVMYDRIVKREGVIA